MVGVFNPLRKAAQHIQVNHFKSFGKRIHPHIALNDRKASNGEGIFFCTILRGYLRYAAPFSSLLLRINDIMAGFWGIFHD